MTSRAAADAEDDHRVWRRLAPSGLLLVGAGLCVLSDAATRKADARTGGSGATAWVAEGTGALALVGAGLSLFGEAVKRRALFDVAQRSRWHRG